MKINYFDQLFQTNIDADSHRYPFLVKNIKRKMAKSPELYDAFRENCTGLTLKDVCNTPQTLSEAIIDGPNTTALLTDFVPGIFVDQIVQYGERQSISRRDFPYVQQSSNSSFRTRARFRHDSVGLYQENDTIYHSTSKRITEEYRFCLLADSVVYSDQLIADSPIDVIAGDLALSASKIAMMEDKMLAHELTYWSDSTIAPEWTPFNFVALDTGTGADPSGPSAISLLDAIETAFLRMVTRLEDSVPASSLRLYLSPAAYTILWRHPDFRNWSVAGIPTAQLRSDLPAFFQMPNSIWPQGYFTPEGWTYNTWDCLIVAPQAAAIRVRQDTRLESLVIKDRLMQGWISSMRTRPHILSPLRYCRIGADETHSDISLLSNVTYRVRDLSTGEQESATTMTKIEAN